MAPMFHGGRWLSLCLSHSTHRKNVNWHSVRWLSTAREVSSSISPRPVLPATPSTNPATTSTRISRPGMLAPRSSATRRRSSAPPQLPSASSASSAPERPAAHRLAHRIILNNKDHLGGLSSPTPSFSFGSRLLPHLRPRPPRAPDAPPAERPAQTPRDSSCPTVWQARRSM